MTGPPRDLAGDGQATTRKVSLVFGLRALQYPFLVLYVVLVPRMMGPEVYGEFALLVSFIAIAVSVADLGLSEVYGRFVPEFEVRGEHDRILHLSSSLLTLKLAIGIAVSAALLGGLVLAYGDRFPTEYLVAVVAAALVADIGSLPYALVFGLNDLGLHALREPVRRVLNLILVLGLFQVLGLFGALLSTFVVETVLCASYFVRTRRWFSLRKLQVDWAFLRPYLAFGFVIYLSWGLTMLWFRSGNAVVDALTGDPAQVAFFDMASQGFSLTAVFMLLVLSSLIPVFTKLLLTGGEGRLTAWAASGVKALSIFATALAVGFAIGGRELVPWILGPDYRPVYANSALLFFGLLPMVVAQAGMVFSVVHRRPGRYVAALAAALAVFLAGAAMLVPRYGALGCSAAMLLGCAVLALAMWLHFRRELSPCAAACARATAPGLPFLALVWIPAGMPAQLLLAAGFLGAYLLILVAGRVVAPGEIRDLVRALRVRRAVVTG